ncbi:reverse transcriptase domain-containing protein [Tanacetum coccineum]
MGSCGMHDGPRRAVHKAMSVGYFWPSMHRDANNEISSCDSCQVYATVPKLPKNDMISVTSAWPFQKWGMDIVGPLPEASGKIKYWLVAINYFTKWLKAKPFINDPLKSWAEGLGVKLVSTSVYHPQANEAIERANQSIMQGIKTSLVYGIEAVIPAKTSVPTRRVIQVSDEQHEEVLRLNLNLLEKRREIAEIREARRKQQV